VKLSQSVGVYVWLWSTRTGTASIPLYANRETNIDEENALFFSLFSSGAKKEMDKMGRKGRISAVEAPAADDTI
jgi:hypothetical protein